MMTILSSRTTRIALFRAAWFLTMPFLAHPVVASASDSAWLLCDDGAIAVNVFEHRAGADARATEFVMLRGGYVLSGKATDGAKRTQIALKGTGSPRARFEGILAPSFVSAGGAKGPSLWIDGTLTLGGEARTMSTELTCKEMGGPLKAAEEISY